jgi:hypothetical protein
MVTDPAARGGSKLRVGICLQAELNDCPAGCYDWFENNWSGYVVEHQVLSFYLPGLL